MHYQRNHIHTAKELILIEKDNGKTGLLSPDYLRLIEFNQSHLGSFVVKNNDIYKEFKKSPSKCMLEKREYFLSHVVTSIHQETLKKPIPLGPALIDRVSQHIK